MILKALVSEPTQSLSTKQISQKIKSYLEVYSFELGANSSRVFFMRMVENLIDLGLVEKTKGPINIYTLNKAYSSEVMMLVTGYFGILDKSEEKA